MSDPVQPRNPGLPALLPELDLLRALVERVHRRLTPARSPAEPLRAIPPPRGAQNAPVRPVPAAEPTPWWPSSRPPGFSLTPTPGHTNQTMADEPVRAMAVLVFGLDGERLQRMIDMIASRQSRHRDFKPVFLTDAPDHHPFTRSNLTFEYFARRVFGTGKARDHAPAYRARMSLLARKWGWSATLDLRLETETARIPPPVTTRTSGVEPDHTGDEEWLDKAATEIRSSGLFDETWYRKQYSVPGSVDAVRHYLIEGAARGYDPHPLFDTTYYARQLGRIL